MTVLRALVGLVASLAAAGPGQAEACRPSRGEAERKHDALPCKPEQRLVPYDPTRVEAGRAPGFIRVSPDTELRIGGRVQVDHDTRR